MMTTTGLGDVQQNVDDDGNRGPCLRRTETRQLRAASEDTASLLSSTSSSAGSSRPWSDDDSPHEDERERRRGTPRRFTPRSSRALTPSMAKKGSMKKVEHSTMANKENAAGSVNTSQAKDASDATKWTSNVEKWQRDDGATTALSPRKNKRKSKKQTADEHSPQSERQILRPVAASIARPHNGNSKYQIPQPVEEPDLENGELCAIEMELLSEASPAPPAKLKPSTSVRSSAIRMMERLPLLHRQSSIENDPEWGFKNAIESRPDLAVEFKSLCELSYPVIFTYVLEFLPGIVSMTLVGHMDSPKTKEYVDGVSLSTMFMNLTGVAFGFGLATAMDTLCSQAYGAGKPMKMGIYFQCGILVLGFTVIPVFLLNWFTDRFLLWMGQPAEVAMLAGRFSRLILPGIPFLYVYELFKKLLQAQNVVKPMVYIAILSNVVNIVLGVYLTWYTSLGYDGAAIARTISNVVLPTALIPYFMMHPEVVRQWWPGWKLSQAIQHLKAFLTLGIPGMFMMLLEWWSFEIMAAFVGWLPDSVVALSVHSVLTNISTLTFNFFLGIAVATNIRVGNYVGSNQPDHAKLASALGMGLSLLVSTALALVVVCTRYLLPVVFINDPTSVSLAGHALLFLMPYQMFDAINSVMQGVFRGTGRQSLAAYINLFGYFAIGLPFGVYLAFNLEFGVEGLWLGLTGGIAAGALISFIKIWRTNWDEMTDAARVRTS